MGKLSKNNKIEVVPEAAKVAIGAVALTSLLYYLDMRLGIGSTLNIVRDDIVMIGYNAVGFCFLWIILHKWFFFPYLKLIEKREELTVGAEEGFLEKEAKLQQLKEDLEVKVLEARTAAMKSKINSVSAAKAEANSLITDAKHESEKSITEARKEFALRREGMEEEINKEAQILAARVMEKILSEKEPLH